MPSPGWPPRWTRSSRTGAACGVRSATRHAPGSLPSVRADRLQLRELIGDLLDNARSAIGTAELGAVRAVMPLPSETADSILPKLDEYAGMIGGS